MDQFKHITVADAQQLIAKQTVTLADIRDVQSYNTSHIDGAIHLSNENLPEFINENDLDTPLIVYCFHGHSSQPAAQYLLEQGFEEVYSLIGGYSAWPTK